MKIYIFEEIISKYDKKIINLLEVNPEFISRVAEIRKMIGIPKAGINEETAEFEKDYLTDNQGNKSKLARPFPLDDTPEAYAYIASFLDDPDYAFSTKGICRNKVEGLRNYFHLEERWYHPLWHIIIFSSIGWLHSPISAFLDQPENKSIWHRPGIVLRITDDISIKQFNFWLKENWNELRERLNKELDIRKKKGLPKDESMSIVKSLIKQKKEKTTYDEISQKLSERYPYDSRGHRATVDSGYLEKRHLRYRKLFGLASKKSHKR